MTLELTNEQAMMIRRAMCDLSTKMLSQELDTEDELKALGRTDTEPVVEFYEEQRDMAHTLIRMIDETMAGNEVVELKIDNMAMVNCSPDFQ